MNWWTTPLDTRTAVFVYSVAFSAFGIGFLFGLLVGRS